MDFEDSDAERALVALSPRNDEELPHSRRVHVRTGYMIERVELQQGCELEFAWSGRSDYVAFHDMKMVEGETSLDDRLLRQHDIRNRLTFVPAGFEIRGWSRFDRGHNSYVALAIEPDMMIKGGAAQSKANQPLLYFVNDALRVTMEKLNRVLMQSGPLDIEYCDSLATTCAMEIYRVQGLSTAAESVHRALSARQTALVQEYIWGHLDRRILLRDLAELLQMSRFHFVRRFKASTGLTPHQYILRCRIDRAKQLLESTGDPITVIAGAVGFATPQRLSAAFRNLIGQSPSEYRRR